MDAQDRKRDPRELPLRLFDLTAHRVVPAPERIARARRVAHAHWTRHLDRRRRRAWFRGLAAASLAAASLAGLLAWGSSSLGFDVWRAPGVDRLRGGAGMARVEMASVARVVGTARIADPRAVARTPRLARDAAATGERLGLGTTIETAPDGRVALLLAGALSLRLDVDTRVVLEAFEAVRLERGAIYVDSGTSIRSVAKEGALRIETAFGTVRHRGTQFDVRVDARGLRTRVREGVISVERSGMIRQAHAGEALRLVPGDLPALEPVLISGADWAWATSVAPPFRLEGATLPAFLDWVSREEGWRWSYGDEVTRWRAARIVLHGSMDRLTPAEAIDPVLAASGLSARRDGDRLIITLRANTR